MGSRFVLRFLAAGLRVSVWDRTPGRVVPLHAAGAIAALSPVEAARCAPAVVVAVTDTPAALDVIFGDTGVAEAEPALVVHTGTISVEGVLEIADRLPAATLFVDAPVVGSVLEAEEGRLRILAAGDHSAIAAARPVLGALGSMVHVGAVGTATKLKHVLNAAVSPMILLLAEALLLGDALDLPRALVLSELRRSRLGPLVERKEEMILAADYPPSSRLRLFRKDMALAVDAGRGAGVSLRLAAIAESLAADAEDAGYGELDYAALIEHIARRAGDSS